MACPSPCLAKTKKSGTYNHKTYQPVNVKNNYIAQSYNSKINGKEFLVYEYVFKAGDSYFAAVVKATCSDMDGCGSANFQGEVEKILDSVTSFTAQKTMAWIPGDCDWWRGCFKTDHPKIR